MSIVYNFLYSAYNLAAESVEVAAAYWPWQAGEEAALDLSIAQLACDTLPDPSALRDDNFAEEQTRAFNEGHIMTLCTQLNSAAERRDLDQVDTILHALERLDPIGI